MVQFVKNITDRWKSGKFMPLLDRTQSVNVYILSKLWYRCGAVDLRKGDIDKMISHIKSWIYADMFLKPEEIKLFCGKKDGGLGMDCIETKSKSNLITSFLEMACNKKYLNNEYMTVLYNFHIEDIGIRKPPPHPFYSAELFATIKQAKSDGLDIVNSKIKDWYQYIIKKNLTHCRGENGEEILRQTRLEYLFPQIDHSNRWKICM